MSHLSSKKVREEDPWNCRPVNPTSHYGKIMGKVLLETTTRQKRTKRFRTAKGGLQGQSYLTNVSIFSDKKINSVVNERTGDANLILMTVYQCPIATLWPNWKGNAWMPVDCKVKKKLALFPFLEKSRNNSKFS